MSKKKKQKNDKPGFVYALEHPSFNGWVKIGRTYRTPHKRILELSNTSVPEPFVLKKIKYSNTAGFEEKKIHYWLKNHPSVLRKKEFFFAPWEIIEKSFDEKLLLFKKNNNLHLKKEFDEIEKELKNSDEFEHEYWKSSYKGRSERLEWAKEWLKDEKTNSKGWNEIEKLALEGWNEAFWHLAWLCWNHNNLIVKKTAPFLMEEAEKQGLNGGILASLWMKTYLNPTEEVISNYLKQINDYREKLNNNNFIVNPWIEEIIAIEQKSWLSQNNIHRKNWFFKI